MKKKEQHYIDVLSDNLFPIVGVGASAGGLEAFKQLVRAIPLKSGIAYILIQHLAPEHESLLPEILQKITEIPVVEITDNIKIYPDHIYTIPSNKLLIANDGVLRLEPRAEGEKHNIIDIFFTSLAEVNQEHAIGIILSGTGTDGTVGLKTIKDQGGITIVQDKASAAFYGMPQSAISSEVVDFVISPEKIPDQLQELVKSARIVPSNFNASEELKDDETFRNILTLMRGKRGVDFSYYKQTTIRRRILRRKAMVKIEKLKDYQNYLLENKEEQEALLKDILIPVTAFFRDANVFDLLCVKILPGLFKAEAKIDPVRIWIAGCSTGEEAYSVAICIYEYLSEHPSPRKTQIFATDLSEISIAKARSGVYQKKDIAGVSDKRIKQFFNKIDGSYQIHKVIREMCVFATHNFLKDPPFAKIDLISCRNVLIYMEAYLQKRAMAIFHYALLETGYLLLGKSESTGLAADQFQTLSKQEKLYSKKPSASKFMHVTTTLSEAALKRKDRLTGNSELRKDDFQKAADDALLSKYAAVGVIVNEQLDIIQFRGSTGAYLEAQPGKASLNILRMAKEGLSFELRNAIHKAKSSGKPYRKENIFLEMGKPEVDIEVIPLQHTIELYFLVLFNNSVVPANQVIASKTKSAASKNHLSTHVQQARTEQLEKELSQVREDMRTIIEDQEAANEELQSANEELLSGSEELQTLNEELETTKEEIQSSNEELTILNQELMERNEQLISSRKYSEAIITTIHEPLMVLTKNFMVRTVNKAYYEKFKVSPEITEGKPFFDIENEMWNVPELKAKLKKILPDKSFFEDVEIQLNLPLRPEMTLIINARQLVNEASNEQLILLAIHDITERKILEQQHEQFSNKLETEVIERTRELRDANLNLQYYNENLQQFATIASHDLQEPLRKIKTFISILNKKFSNDLDERAKEVVAKIALSADRMSQLIKEVLQYSRVVHAAKKFQPTNMHLIMTNVIGDLELMIAEKKATINYLQPLPEIDAIPLQINQLFYNLLINALKFSRQGIAPVINISYRMVTEKDLQAITLETDLPNVEITISDNGIGFEQQFAGQIFQIFERLHSTDEFEGTGIGLALCKKIVENHNGFITATSVENEGATFIMALPCHQEGSTHESA